MFQYFVTPTTLQRRLILEKYSKTTPKRRSKDSRTNYDINKRLLTKRLWLLMVNRKVCKRLTFWTISFPIGTSDGVAYVLLNSWLTNLRTHHNLENYIWIAERQKNQTIHFHIFLAGYIDARKANKAMKSALTTQLRKDKIDKEQAKQISTYNGVHLSKTKNGKVINLAGMASNKQRVLAMAYVTKYVTKAPTDKSQKFTRLRWFCSRQISRFPLSMQLQIEEVEEHFLEYHSVESHKHLNIEGVIDLYIFSFIPKSPAFLNYLDYVAEKSKPKPKDYHIKDFEPIKYKQLLSISRTSITKAVLIPNLSPFKMRFLYFEESVN